MRWVSFKYLKPERGEIPSHNTLKFPLSLIKKFYSVIQVQGWSVTTDHPFFMEQSELNNIETTSFRYTLHYHHYVQESTTGTEE